MKEIQFPIRKLPEMFCFGGYNTTIQIDKIKNIEVLYYYEDFKTDRRNPILYIELKNDILVTVDFETIEEAEEALKEFKKHCIFKRVK